VFSIFPLKAHIFDPSRTDLITKAELRDSVMIRIIRLISVTENSGKKGGYSGRISYSKLGVNQLGAVYENLLSFSGFFAKEALYEVKREKDDYSELNVGYFVTAKELEDYNEKERVYYNDKK
jgi:hypothetical protein